MIVHDIAGPLLLVHILAQLSQLGRRPDNGRHGLGIGPGMTTTPPPPPQME